MKYINALHLIDLSIENNLIKTQDEKLLIYRMASKEFPEKYPEGWYLEDKDYMVHELMEDKEGQDFLIEELRKLNIKFQPVYKEDNLIIDFKDIKLS